MNGINTFVASLAILLIGVWLVSLIPERERNILGWILAAAFLYAIYYYQF